MHNTIRNVLAGLGALLLAAASPVLAQGETADAPAAPKKAGVKKAGARQPAAAAKKGPAKGKAAADAAEEAAAATEKKEKPKITAAVSPGDKAPGFFLKAVNADVIGKKRVVLDQLFEDPNTKGVIISFFATWCGPCKKELPILQKLWSKYQEQGLRVVTVSIDKEQEAVDGLKGFVDQYKLTYPVVSDRFNLLARRYLGTTTSLPSLFITDSGGVIRAIHQSYDEDAEALLENEIRTVMGLGEVEGETEEG